MDLALVGDRPLATSAVLNLQTGPDMLTIDATQLRFACPLDLVGMVAMAHWAVREGIAVTFKLPATTSVTAYLHRMDVLNRMPRQVELVGRIGPALRSELSERLLEVTRLTPDNVGDVLVRVGRLIDSFYADSAPTVQSVFGACGELLDNATSHGHSPEGAFIAIQTHSGETTEGRRIEIAICDLGIGVRAHLKQNPRYDYLVRDDAALAHAIREEVSGLAECGRGFGLYDLVRGAQKHGSLHFEMRSGCGELTVDGATGSTKPELRLRDDQTAGTWAWLTHRTRVPR